MRQALILCAGALVSLLGASLAEAQDQQPPAETAEPSSACASLALRLDGASAQYDAADTQFREEWRPQLELAARCLAEPAHARSCIEVQGQYDERTFDKATTRALGSERAAQLHRARARGEAVLSELHAMGTAAARLRERPPPTRATFRGVTVTLVGECIEEPSGAALPAWASSPESLASELKQRGLLPEPTIVAAPPAPPPPPPAPSPFWLDAGLAVGGMLGEPKDFVLGGPQIGAGYGGEHIYVRLGLAAQLGGLPEQRAGIEYMIAGGYRALPWLDVGLLAAHRIAAAALFEPWLSQAWRIGLESSQRLLEHGAISVWVNEAVSPLGERVDRAVIVGDRVFELDEQRYYALRLDLSVSVRGRIF